jgi:preprotein translocase subunit SecE
MSRIIKGIKRFITECMSELKKCTWPERDVLVESTLLVIVVMTLLSLYVFLIDQAGHWFIRLITGTL